MGIGWRRHSLDGAVLDFDPGRGINVLRRGPETAAQKRAAPRSLQIALSNACNLTCGFCYREPQNRARWTHDSLVEFLRGAADWGVLEVAFGGGEPLLYEGFPELLQLIRHATPLALNFTTNGTLLDARMLGRLGDAVSEIRVSAYKDNHYRKTLRLLRGKNTGVNLLVTPANVGLVEAYVLDFLKEGAQNVLLLGYMGSDETMRLSPSELHTLRASILRLQALPIRLHICWYPLLADLPHLFARPDCGAGDEFLVITSDRCVQACSFGSAKWPFESINDVKRIYSTLRAQRPASDIGGCTRAQFAPVQAEVGTFVWEAHSSNNSGDWTIVGKFVTVAEARAAAEALRALARAHEAFLASDEGQAWIQSNGYDGSVPSPPLIEFGDAHGFTWNKEGDGLWWEEDGAGAPVLTAGAVGDTVVVYHPYCMGLPEAPFKDFFRRVGATEWAYWQYDRPSLVVSARGKVPQTEAAIERYLQDLNGVEYPSDLKAPPPWGAVCTNPRVLSDEDNSARPAPGFYLLTRQDDGFTLTISMENTFAGALAIEDWLIAQGYESVSVQLTFDAEPLTAPADRSRPVVIDKNKTYGIQTTHEWFASAEPEQLIEWALKLGRWPQELSNALKAVPPGEIARLGHGKWMSNASGERMKDAGAVALIELAGPAAREWALDIWRRNPGRIALCALGFALPRDEVFELARNWVTEAASRREKRSRLTNLGGLRHPGVLELVAAYWDDTGPRDEIRSEWIELCAEVGFHWRYAREWINRGRPHSTLALAVLAKYALQGPPDDWERPTAEDLKTTLDANAEVERTAKADWCRGVAAALPTRA